MSIKHPPAAQNVVVLKRADPKMEQKDEHYRKEASKRKQEKKNAAQEGD